SCFLSAVLGFFFSLVLRICPLAIAVLPDGCGPLYIHRPVSQDEETRVKPQALVESTRTLLLARSRRAHPFRRNDAWRISRLYFRGGRRHPPPSSPSGSR